MNTLRVCATLGLGLSLALGSGCKSDSNSTKKDAAPVDGRRTDAPGTNTSPDTTPAQDCVVGGTTIKPGRSATINCVTWTCVSGNIVTGSGTACTGDAGPTPDVAPTPDVQGNRDTTVPVDTRLVEAGAPIDVGGKDVQPGEAGTIKDVGGNKDTFVPDVFVSQPDVFVPEDTTPPTPDLTPLQCTSGGTNHNPGDTFACGCNTCFCSSAGVTQQLSNYVPGDTFACDCNTCLCNSANAIQKLTNNVCTLDAG